MTYPDMTTPEDRKHAPAEHDAAPAPGMSDVFLLLLVALALLITGAWVVGFVFWVRALVATVG
jgi:hypothetical protein